MYYGGGTGNKRDNPVEAARVADLVIEQIRAYPQQSVGVITMSEAQQNAVLDAIEKRKNADSVLARLLSEDGAEGFFVKNIENVQGDERDVIFLSIGYGRDAKTGVFRLNFGPLNKEGGERRLNVAVTRARLRCVTVASFLPGDINKARTDKSGPLLLRDYMEKAIQSVSLADNLLDEAQEKDGFVQAIANALTQRGHKVQQNVGLFDFRIDIGILDDGNPDRFLMGIECDGQHYLSGETARARERLRDEVLRGLDWRLHRVWSTDWVRNPAQVLQTIEEALLRAKRGEPEPAEQKMVLIQSTPEPVAQNAPTEEMAMESGLVESLPDVQMPPSDTTSKDLLPGLTYFKPMDDADLADLARAFWSCDEDEQAGLHTQLVETEGPLLFSAAAQKIASSAGFARTGNRLNPNR